MDTKQIIEKIAKFKENEVGPSEEDVKQKIVVPILEILGHKREELQFQYRTKSGGKIYSISELAKVLMIKHGFKRDEHGVAGPKYWRTEEGKLLNNLNEQIRRQRGDKN